METGDPSRAALHIQAASKLQRIDPTALEPIPLLLSALGDEDEKKRAGALVALGEIRPFEEPVIRALIEYFPKGNAALIRQRLVWGLERRPEARSIVVPVVTQWLNDPSGYVRAAALTVLPGYGPRALPPLSELLVLLYDEDDDVRHQAAAAIGRLGPKAVTAIPHLIEIMKDRNYVEQREYEIRRQSNSQLGGRSRSSALIHNPARGLRGECAAVLGQIGRQASYVVKELIKALNDEDLKKEAIKSLGRFRTRGTPAIPVLSSIVAEEEGDSSDFAAMALQLIQPINTATLDSFIVRAKQDRADELQAYTIEALEVLGPVAASAEPHLEQILETTRYESVRMWTQKALASIRDQ